MTKKTTFNRIEIVWNYILKIVKKNYRPVLVILGFFLIWELIVRIFNISELVLPSPSCALDHLFNAQPDANYNWGVHIGITIKEFVLGFLFTAVFGIFIAIVVVWSKTMEHVLMPAFVFINSLPIIALAPIILLWLGYGLKTNILIAFLCGFFPVVINTIAGLESVEDDLLDLVNYLGASKFQLFTKIRIPNALPYIFSGLKICTTMSVVGAIVGEFIASDKGLGYIIINSQYTMDTPPIFSALMVISVAGGGMYMIVSFIEHLIMPWMLLSEKK